MWGLFALFTEQPWLALLPAGGFLAGGLMLKVKPWLVTGAAWLAYAIYEFAVSARLICSGECNIRVDLLLIAPLLLLASAFALLRPLFRRRPPQT